MSVGCSFRWHPENLCWEGSSATFEPGPWAWCLTEQTCCYPGGDVCPESTRVTSPIFITVHQQLPWPLSPPPTYTVGIPRTTPTSQPIDVQTVHGVHQTQQWQSAVWLDWPQQTHTQLLDELWSLRLPCCLVLKLNHKRMSTTEKSE